MRTMRRRRALPPRRVAPRAPEGWATPTMREVESRIWPWRLVAGAGVALALLLARAVGDPGPLALTAGGYLLAYLALRLSRLRGPWFDGLLLGLDLAAITALVGLSGGAQSGLALLYVFPVVVVAMVRGLRPALAVATAALLLHLGAVGPGPLWAQAPQDTAGLGLTLYLAALVAGQVTVQVERARGALAGRLTALHERLVGLSRAGAIAELLQGSVDAGRELTGARHAAVAVWDAQGRVAHFLTAGVDPAAAAAMGPPPTGRGLLGVVRDAPRPIRLADGGRHPAASPLPPGHPALGPFLGVPIPALGDWKGAFYLLGRAAGGGFTADDAHLGEMLAAQVGAAVVMRRLVASQQEMYDSLLEMLVEISDTREHAIQGHSTRVSRWARALAERLELPADAVNRIAVAGLLHDIGKIGVSDEILRKPGPLTEDERTLMMAHAALGAGIVEHAGPLAPIAPIVRHHHEWWDGRGYPEGLRGEAIPLGARIVTLADTLDSMTTPRPYRAARTLDAALAEVARGAGTQFDPRLAALVPAVVGPVAPGAAGPGPAGGEPATLAERYRGGQVAGWQLLGRVAEALRAGGDLPQLAERALTPVRAALGVEAAALSVLEADGSALRLVAWQGHPCLLPVGRVLGRGAGLMWAALEAGTPLVLTDVEAHPRYRGRRGEGRRAGVFVPLGASAGVQGVLAVHRPGSRPFGEQTVRQLEAVGCVLGEALAVARLQGQLRAQAQTDPLTGVGSRGQGLAALDAACARAARGGGPFALVLLNLDDFRAVNARYGARTGDAVLRQAVETVRARLRAGDAVARLGGDELLVLLPDADPEDAARLVRQLRPRAGGRTLVVDGRTVRLPTWSAGIAVWADDGTDADALLRVATARLRQPRPAAAGTGGSG